MQDFRREINLKAGSDEVEKKLYRGPFPKLCSNKSVLPLPIVVVYYGALESRLVLSQLYKKPYLNP